MSEELDPSEFVQRIRQLGEQRDQQDAERVRKLEEEIIQGRSERLARRAERARSLSPDKPSTPHSQHSAAGTPRSIHDKAVETSTPVMEPSSQQEARDDSLQRLTSAPAQQLEDFEPKKPAPSAAALGRSGTLSWQRRPQSGSIRRPLSMASTTDKTAATSPPPQQISPEPSSPERPVSRNQIAQALGGKDPSWFRQTADRGIGSAAYRRNQDDTPSEVGSVSGRRQLPGMSRDSTAEPEVSSPPPESVRSTSPSVVGSVRGSAALSNRFSTNTSISGGDGDAAKAKSALPTLDSQKFAPPSDRGSVDGGDQASVGRGLAMSPAQGRISPERNERPGSPTKGMGGFVQSAMLKRSDSVNKRWSTQAPPGLSRQSSTVSNRGSVSGYGSISRYDRPAGLSRENSTEPSSRPGSSSSNLTLTKDATEKDTAPKDEFVKPALPHHSRSKSVASTFSEDNNRQQDETSPPSPSKRWSPTKSSWLENALNKPNSPNPKQQAPAQPAWMTEINRIKQQRGSVDLSKGSSIQSPPAESTPSGRSSPIKDVQLKPVGLRKAESPKKEEHAEQVTEATKPKPLVTSPKPSLAAKEEPKAEESSPSLDDTELEEAHIETATAVKPLSTASRFSKASVASPPSKPKPDTPPKKDFRSTLRSRPATSDTQKNEASELQNVFGKLRKTETKNYVAPDTFKNNILRGKAGLAVTGGPKPSVRKDEFRDSLISQKQAMLAKAQETGSAAHKRTDSQPTATPEAIARRKTLSRSDSINQIQAPKEASVPEALARQQNFRASKQLSEKPAPAASLSTREEPVAPKESAAPKEPAPSKEPIVSKEPVKSSKLADRFNPALAGLLARGPSPLAANRSSSGDSPSGEAASKPAAEEKQGSAPELTHMTKGRARGPKRRAPASKSAAPQQNSSPPKEVVSPVKAVPLVKADDIIPSNAAKADTAPEQPTTARTPARDSLKAKPATPAKSPDLSKRISSASFEQSPKPASLELERKIIPEETPKNPAQVESSDSPKMSPVTKVPSWKSRPLPTPPPKPETPLKEIAPPNSETTSGAEMGPDEGSGFSVKNATALWGRQSATSSPAPTRTKSPIKLPTKADEQAANENAGLVRPEEPIKPTEPATRAPKPKPAGLGLGSLGVFSAARSRESSPPKPNSAKDLPATPPTSGGGRPQSEPFKVSPMPEKSDGIFADFFDEPPVTTGELPKEIDTQTILTTSPLDMGKIRTLRKQIQELSGDGKLSSVPMQEEHVLFQDSMYLCTHVFGDSKGAKITEVYLWSGNGVAEATLEDAQLFARNAAKQSQGKLTILRQGKETPNFFEALGGIVITRRGSRPASKRYMLCGRRHMGHIAFDEVDFSLKGLCSGFPYIISSENGKVFLWKGRGCSAEEVSGARLMGMDLTPTGELIEIDEGSEPPELFEVFPPADDSALSPRSKGKQSAASAIPRSADHWKYKPTNDKYRARLFKIEQQQGSAGWGQTLQVSSFFASLRRPSWQSFSNPGDRPTEPPQTPTTPRSPVPPVTTKVVEVMPFCQRDLEPENIYVLDAFFEMYIIVGALSRNQSTAFSTALLFAQEYSILAVSAEDRPFVPVTTVVLEGVPRDMKAVFRHWDDALIPAAGLMRGKLGRGKSLRIVGLEKAIEATRR